MNARARMKHWLELSSRRAKSRDGGAPINWEAFSTWPPRRDDTDPLVVCGNTPPFCVDQARGDETERGVQTESDERSGAV